MESNQQKYGDIIHLPHHVSATRPQMSIADRAAQFAPFAALTGHDDAIRETARLTHKPIELDENAIELLNEKLHIIFDNIDSQPKVTVTYFVPDNKKGGGAYVDHTGVVSGFDDFRRCLIFADKKTIFVDDIYQIEADILSSLF